MQTRVSKIHRHSLLSAISCAAILALVLAACGTNPTTSGSPGSSPTQAATSTQALAHGCPNTTIVSTPPPAANVILTSTSASKTASAQKGDTIEIDLPYGASWAGPMKSSDLLALQNPAGYDSPTAKACVWRFVANGTGTAQVSFTARALCRKGQACPMYVRVVSFTIDIK
ncbi:MAG TPA: hypothetical protein VKV19_10010 [Ktedonobacteraceae bacterium]|jgi:hypothetical protein|nr:hypothetical protein [Ktedonobacteraceae bacterium]